MGRDDPGGSSRFGRLGSRPAAIGRLGGEHPGRSARRLSAGEAFVHLHVASGYSMQYGASTPAALVQRAVAWGQPALALTDRDGLYGAVRFVQACTEAGIDPILGVDLAVDLTGRPDRRPHRSESLRRVGTVTADPSRAAGPGLRARGVGVVAVAAAAGRPADGSHPAQHRVPRTPRAVAAGRSEDPGAGRAPSSTPAGHG